MMCYTKPIIFLFVFSRGVFGYFGVFSMCHDDFTLKPADGILKRNTFNWLGFVQYIHITTGLPNHSKAPRVILVHKQFVVGTANDLLHLPKNYKLGNVVFGQYERDEMDCGMTQTQVNLGIKCPPAYIEVPPLDVTAHPEYSRFGVGNSLALVRLLRSMKSEYMVPVCMPTVAERYKKKRNRFVFLVDYLSIVPRDFDTERMGKKTLKLYTHKECRRHRMKAKLGSEGVTHVLCTSGCGVRSGAPIISHNSDGGFELIGIAAGGGPCTRKGMRQRLIKEPPLYVDVFPYVTWMTNVINAHELPLAYSQNFRLVEGGTSLGLRHDYVGKQKTQRNGWRSRVFVSGNFCFQRARKQKLGAFFYSEKFEVNANPPARFTVLMKFSAGIECTILCARLEMPNRLVTPVIEGVGRYNISISFSTAWFPYTFYYSLGLVGKNTSERNLLDWQQERSPGFCITLWWKPTNYRHFKVSVMNRRVLGYFGEFTLCHDDFTLNPKDGILKRNTFTWLGFVQYFHVTTGLLHQSKAPRVVLVHKQFVIGTAIDLLQLPTNYKLGNMVFGEYERDEMDCGMTRTQVKMGAKCPPAFIEIPLLDIIPHPEYSRFGVGNSLALVKLLRPMISKYMVPVCMPTLGERYRKMKHKYVIMIDYISNVPNDFDTERMAKKSLQLLTHKECRKHRMQAELGSIDLTQVLCTSGCGVRPGAPIISHNADGSFELFGIAAGGGPCMRSGMRQRFIEEPPFFVDVFPYVTWILNVITANELPLPYPQNFKLAVGGTSMGLRKNFLRSSNSQYTGWRSRTFLSGKFCFKSKRKQLKRRDAKLFYYEKFDVISDSRSKFTIYMKISAGIETTILCARLMMPNRLLRPVITGVGGYNVSVHFSTDWLPYTFYYTLGLVGRNSTDAELNARLQHRSPGYF